MTTRHHHLPALTLFLLAPLLAEYLLGNIPLGSTDALAAYLPVALLYGTGALIIRESALRAGRGWPTIAVLAVAYGVIEEGTVTQSLFNPSYVDLHLNDYGTIPGTGTGAPWALYVLTLHCVWSIVVPIAVVHALFPGASHVPWLPRPLLAAAAVPYLFGAALLGVGTHLSEGFLATPAQLGAALAMAGVLVVTAFLLPGPRRDDTATRRHRHPEIAHRPGRAAAGAARRPAQRAEVPHPGGTANAQLDPRTRRRYPRQDRPPAHR